ncbi:hypothetical protein AMS68_004713 [Peltaster fructicola]|uniref:Cell wall mannoprotein PIR1-like C-terminal domain-containing protein n=1 Tax=Peltaster fructicola TaxID=286661 RepID=A0A6H0XWY6_9PEZI|nr:hypothetical protein AMS68_004713 [Peltaster fructicola]
MKYSYCFLAALPAVLASPVPDANKAQAPAGCKSTYSGTFGIVARQALSQIPDGQIQAPWGTSHPVWTTTPAQPTTPATTTSQKPASSNSQQPSSSLSMKPPVSQINDGQIQNPIPPPPGTKEVTKPTTLTSVFTTTHKTTTTDKTTVTKPCSTATITKTGPTATVKTTHTVETTHTVTKPGSTASLKSITTVTMPKPCTTSKSSTSSITPCTTKTSDMSKPCTTSKPSTSSTTPCTTKTSGTVVSQLFDGQVQVPSGKPQSWNNIGACAGDNALSLTLKDGILKDARGWTGYIAANRQLQFDNPPQAGALSTSGFSVCGNGSLALGGSTVFYECLSGNFYNIYDQWIAPQCHPVSLNVAQLVKC